MTHSKLSLGSDSIWSRVKRYVFKRISTWANEGDIAWDIRIDADSKAQIISLKYHAGFNALMGLFELRKRALVQACSHNRPSDLREIDSLQARIGEIEWLQRAVSKQVRPTSTDSYEEEDLSAVVKQTVLLVGPPNA